MLPPPLSRDLSPPTPHRYPDIYTHLDTVSGKSWYRELEDYNQAAFHTPSADKVSLGLVGGGGGGGRRQHSRLPHDLQWWLAGAAARTRPALAAAPRSSGRTDSQPRVRRPLARHRAAPCDTRNNSKQEQKFTFPRRVLQSVEVSININVYNMLFIQNTKHF